MQAVSSSKLRIVQTAHNSVSCPAAAPRACMAGLLQFAGPLRQSLASSAGLVPRAYASALSVRSVAASAVAMSKAQGTVKWFNSVKGFGFITPTDGGADLFVHQTSIQADGFRSLAEGEPVEFDIETDPQGRTRAVQVTGPGGANVQGQPRDSYMEGGGGGRSFGGGGGGYTDRRAGGRKSYGGRDDDFGNDYNSY